jgi:hypothetical protein
MNAALVTNIGDLRNINSDELVSKITEGFKNVYSQSPSPDEKSSWVNSIPALISKLPSTCDELPIIIEMRMPIGNERADIIILGGNDQAIIVELKHWKGKIQPYGQIDNQVLLGGESGLLRTHPCYQCDGYVGKIKNFHSIGNTFKIMGLVFLDSIPFSQNLDNFLNTFNSTIIYSDRTDELSDIICEKLLPNSLSIDDAIKFSEGTYTISGRLVDFIRENQNKIKHKIYKKLADSGFSLCDEQLNAVNEILKNAKEAVEKKTKGLNPSKKAFVVNGPPGSGKTLVALSLLIEAIGSGVKSIYGLRRNRALINTLRNTIDDDLNDVFNDLSGLVYFINSPRNQMGIADKKFNQSNIDMIICDEGQRMVTSSFPVIFERCNTTVFFVDETQRLNWDEQGVKENFIQAAESNNVELIFLESLPAGIRCRGGLPYHNFLESLLLNPTSINEGFLDNPPWGEEYSFRVFSDFDSFYSALQDAHENLEARVALVASWTESDGDHKWRLSNRPNTSLKNTRVSEHLQSGRKYYHSNTPTISWVMNPDDYRMFWSGKSSDLDICASIYGAHGFESDIVGFIWGNDLKWENELNNWSLGGKNTSYDYSGGDFKRMSVKNLMNQIDHDRTHEHYETVKTLLINRARIFLTRGILGTYVYCEDEETREYLLSL